MADDVAPAGTGGVWLWFPTNKGGVRRSEVTSFEVERTDGEFKGGHRSSFTIRLFGPNLGDGVTMRPLFFGPQQLCEWVDMVFPGAAFSLLPPPVVLEAPDWEAPEQPALAAGVRAVGHFGHGPADAIRVIGGGLAGGNSYEPAQGYHPPPGVTVAI